MGQNMSLQFSMSRNGREVSIPMCETSTNMGRFICGVMYIAGMLYGAIYYCPLVINYKILWSYSYFILIYSMIFIFAVIMSLIISDLNMFVDKQLKLRQRTLWQKRQQKKQQQQQHLLEDVAAAGIDASALVELRASGRLVSEALKAAEAEDDAVAAAAPDNDDNDDDNDYDNTKKRRLSSS